MKIASPNLTFINGQWYDGKSFRLETIHSIGGLLTRQRLNTLNVPTEIVDLAGGYVIPPLADAHCHHFDGPFNVEQIIAMYLKDGIFYAQSNGNSARDRRDPRVAARVNQPRSVDVTYADASLTSTLGHPFSVYEALANGIYDKSIPYAEIQERIKNTRKGEGDTYIFADTPEMLDKIWPQYEKRRPDFIKILLLHSENYATEFPKQVPGAHGLNPALAPEIVKRAHQIGLRVFAHVDTAHDFHVCVMAGVDGFAHMPGYAIGKEEDPKNYEITEADARLAGRRKTIVQPTSWLAVGYADGNADYLQKAQTIQKRNLKLLKKHGVRFAIGSDSYGTDSWPEVEYQEKLGVFTRAELLNLWCEQTAQTIFPGRKIGRLTDGYEASFLVLEHSPLDNLQHLKEITMRVKQGYRL
jgi:imidazolonepropionase-like amidohydrolase